MLTPELKNYCDLYQKLLSELIELHNYHLIFKNQLGRDSGHAVRKILRRINKTSKEMQRSNYRAYREKVKNNIEKRELKKKEMLLKSEQYRERVAQSKLKKQNKGNKNEQHNNPDASPV